MNSISSQSGLDVRIAVLGPMRIWRNGVEHEIPTAKPRGVLALLLAEHNRPVSAADIVSVVWPDLPPPSAVNLVQKYVGQLRRLLSGQQTMDERAQPTLERGGYRLRLDADVVDLLRFRRLVAHAGGDDVAAFESLVSALELWHGPSFGGLPASMLSHPVFESIDSEYFAVVLRAAQLGQSLGRLDRLLAPLHQACARRPLDEVVHAWWILALAAAGRRAEALAGYTMMRRRLVQELGLEPGPELRDAHRSVLRQDVRQPRTRREAAVAPRATSATVNGEPQNIAQSPPKHRWHSGTPSEQTNMYGRGPSLEGLVRRLVATETRLVTVTGLAGVGKTWLAEQATHQLANRFARIVWVALAGVERTELILDAIGAAMVEPTGPVADVLQRLAAQPTLLVLDNLEHLNNPSPVLIDLLSACPDLRVLATSRRPTRTAGEQEWPLGPMPIPGPDEDDPAVLNQVPSVQLFVDRTRALRPAFTLTAENAAAVGQLCRQLDGLPLAVELAAAQCRALEPGDLLRRNGELLVNLPATAGQPSLQAALQASYDLLDEESRAVLRLLATFRSGWSLDAAAAIVGDGVDAACGLNTLAGHGMVVIARPAGAEARYEMLETIRHYTVQRNQIASGLPEYRHAEYFLQLAERVAPVLQGGNSGATLAALEPERDNLRQALAFLTAVRPADAARLAIALYRYWLFRGRNREGIDAITTILDRADGDPPTPRHRARCHLLAANLALFDNDLVVARKHAERGLVGYQTIGDQDGLAAAHTTFGMLSRQEGERQEGLRHARAAVAAAERSTDRRLLVICLNNQAATLQDLGQLPEAAEAFDRALRLAQDIGENHAASISAHNLGENARLRGDLNQAERGYQQALRLRKRLGDLAGTANTEATWAVVKAIRGQTADAQRLIESANQRLNECDVPYARGAVHWARAELNLQMRLPAAEEFGCAVEDLLRAGDHTTCVEALAGLAATATAPDLAGRAAAAANYLHQVRGVHLSTHARNLLAGRAFADDGFTQDDLEDLLHELRKATD